MKRLLMLLILSPFFTTAQEKLLLAEGVSPALYVTHKVAPKENYYSIGRIYNISPKEIAPFNNLQLESGLSLGQVIKVPLSNANFFQSGTADADEVFVPVYYTVKGKEGLYRVALNHNNLSLETLKQWNNIKGDAVKNGTNLIVGYLKVKKDQSYLAKNGIGTSINANVIAAAKKEDKSPAIEKPNKKITAEEAGPPSINPDKFPTAKNPDNEKKEVVKAVKETAPAETKKAAKAEKNNTESNFKNLYNTQTKNAEIMNAEGTASIFKSTSGWNDKKYYCLYNNASPGIIIKITNPASGKSVYAKVLDVIPDIKQNSGMIICISNAAAAELDAGENSFNCLLQYAK